MDKKINTFFIISVIIATLLAGGGIYGWQKSELQSVRQGLQRQISDLQHQLTRNELEKNIDQSEERENSSVRYKKFSLLNMESEIPENWSILTIPEMVGDDELTNIPTGAIGKNDVTHGDMNLDQINFYFASKDIADRLIQESKRGEQASDSLWSTETIGGIKARVNVFSLDEGGGVSKAGSGGKKYFLTLPDTYNPRTLVIWKQTRGDEKFEVEFNHFIEAIKFQQK